MGGVGVWRGDSSKVGSYRGGVGGMEGLTQVKEGVIWEV